MNGIQLLDDLVKRAEGGIVPTLCMTLREQHDTDFIWRMYLNDEAKVAAFVVLIAAQLNVRLRFGWHNAPAVRAGLKDLERWLASYHIDHAAILQLEPESAI